MWPAYCKNVVLEIFFHSVRNAKIKIISRAIFARHFSVTACFNSFNTRREFILNNLFPGFIPILQTKVQFRFLPFLAPIFCSFTSSVGKIVNEISATYQFIKRISKRYKITLYKRTLDTNLNFVEPTDRYASRR